MSEKLCDACAEPAEYNVLVMAPPADIARFVAARGYSARGLEQLGTAAAYSALFKGEGVFPEETISTRALHFCGEHLTYGEVVATTERLGAAVGLLSAMSDKDQGEWSFVFEDMGDGWATGGPVLNTERESFMAAMAERGLVLQWRPMSQSQ